MTTVADQMIAQARRGPKDPNAFIGCGIGMDAHVPKKPAQWGDFSGPKDPNRFMGMGMGMDVLIKQGKKAFGLEKPVEASVHERELRNAEKICLEMKAVLKSEELQATELHNLKQYAAYLADRLHQDCRNVTYLTNTIGKAIDFTTRRGDQATRQLCAESQITAQKIANDLTEAHALARRLASDLEAQTFDANSAKLKMKLRTAETKFDALHSSLKKLRQAICLLK